MARSSTTRRRTGPATKPKKRSVGRSGLTVKTYSGLNKKRMQSRGGGGNKVIIKEGDTVPVQFLQTPRDFKEYDQHTWQEDGRWWYVPCTGEDCESCESESEKRRKRNYKFVANVWNVKEKKVQILEGPKTVATQVFYRYQRKPQSFLKRVFDITRFPTNPVTYNFELAEEEPVRTKGLKLFDLDEYLQGELERFYGSDDDDAKKGKGKKKPGKSALDDDDDDLDDDEWDDEDEDDDDDEEDEEEPTEEELLDKDAWPLGELKSYAKEVGVKNTDRKRKELVRLIMKKLDS